VTKQPADLIRPAIQSLRAYHVPDATGYIKLDAMENPYAWPSELTKQWQALLADAAVNRYPDPQAGDLAKILREVMGIDQDQGLVLGNGSDELIQLLMMAVNDSGASIMSVDPTFVMYEMIAGWLNMPYVSVPLTADYALDLPLMLDKIRKHKPAIVFLAWPNNPTGTLFSPAEIDTIIAAAYPGWVVVDEAYTPFVNAEGIDRQYFLNRAGEVENLLVMRTLSKLGLAGLRIGLLTGAPALVQALDKVRLPYNLNVLGQLTATFALQHIEVFNQQAFQLCEQRAWMMTQLAKWPNISVWPSQANFLLFRMKNAQQCHQKLLEDGVMIKSLVGHNPRLTDCLRLTIGLPEENRRFIESLTKIVPTLA